MALLYRFFGVTIPLRSELKYIELFFNDHIKASATLDIAPLGRSLPPTQIHCRFAYYSR